MIDETDANHSPPIRGRRSIFASATRSLTDHLILVLSVLFLFSSAMFVLWERHLSGRLIERVALEDAYVFSTSFSEFRALYTTEVVDRVQEHGIVVTHDYRNQKGAIPLPSTLTMELSHRIGIARPGSEVRFYSPYPFPWRNEGGARDQFEKEAFRVLSKDPKQHYYRFEDYNHRRSLRYAVADVTTPACARCHNDHPDSPKRNWQVGEVMGVIEIIQPLDNVAAMATRNELERFLLFGLSTVSALVGIALTIGRLRRNSADLAKRNDKLLELMRALEDANNKLERLSLTDGLTNLFNRRALDLFLATEWKRAIREHTCLSLIMIDIDFFKNYNDNYGHARGDRCLQRVASVVGTTARRAGDLAVRYGGEEFLLVLLKTNLKDAVQVAEELRHKVELLRISHAYSETADHVTIALGVAAVAPTQESKLQWLLEEVDQRLYRAKTSGRNRVCSS